jgi:cytochrome c-type biogenesis protein CcmF
MALSLIVAAALIIYRRRSLADPNPPGALFSRSGMFFLTMLLFLTFTATVFIGSVLPTISETLTGARMEAGPGWFDHPKISVQFMALMLLIGVCPLLGRTAGTLRRLGTRGWPALVGAVLVVVVAVLAGFTKGFSLISFAVVGLAGGTTLAEFVRGVAARSRQEDPLRAFWNLFGRNRRKYGGYLVHVGVIFMALGIVGTRVYPFETQAVLPAGEPVDVGDYTLIFEEVQQEPAPDHVTAFATVSVYRDGAYLTTCQPQTNQYLNHDQTVAVPALRAGLREDLYLLLSGFSNVTATFKVFVNPMASFLWLGGLIFLTGGAVAVWPSSRRQSAWSVVGPVLGLLLLVGAGWAMWGTGNCAAATGRPLPGQPAPDFTLDLLDGSTLALSELRGQVAVVNFWATWCPPCEDEMPDLQAVWEEYQADGVVFVGIAYEDEEVAVREMISRFGITYPQGLDVGALISTAYGITGVPETFLVDSQGRVAGLHVGPVSAEELRGELDSLLGR